MVFRLDIFHNANNNRIKEGATFTYQQLGLEPAEFDAVAKQWKDW